MQKIEEVTCIKFDERNQNHEKELVIIDLKTLLIGVI